RQRGTSMSLGVPGIWNPYGERDLRLVNEVFGQSEVKDEEPGKWKWWWRIAQPSPKLSWQVTDANKKLTAALATCGKGRLLVSTGTFNDSELKARFYETLDLAIGKRPANCATNAFELVSREDKRGQRYLFVLNPHTRETRQDEIILAGRFAHCRDLGVGSGVPLPVSVTKSET